MKKRFLSVLLMIVILGMIVPVCATIPGYSISKSSSKDMVNPGETITFSITMSNAGTLTEHHILHVNDDWSNLPGLPNKGIPFTQPGTSSCSWTGGNAPVICSFGEVPAGGSITVSFPFTISHSASYGTNENAAYINEATDIKAQKMITVADTPLEVVSTDPVKGATGVLGNPTITVTFDKWISDDSSHPLTGTITINDGTKNIDYDYAWAFAEELQFGNHAGPWLAPDTVYTVTIDGFKDLAGKPMTSPNSWTFKTGADTTPPIVISTSPADEAIKVPVNVQVITIKFSENIELPLGSGGIQLLTYNDEYPYYVDYDFGQITVTGDTLSINAPGTMDPWFKNWKHYYVTVEGVYDTAGNEMVYQDIGYNPPVWFNYYRFSFQTVSTDITPPKVLSTYPVDGASNVPSDVTITAVMSKLINRCVGTVTMVDSNNNPVALLYGDQYFTTDDYKNLKIKPLSPLVKGKTYTVTMQGLIDGYHNVMNPYSWSFTVGTSPVANAGADQTVIVNEILQFDGSKSTDADGTIVAYAWDFGDTKTGSGVNPTHIYTLTGTYTAKLTVTDNDGLIGSDTAVITVKTPAETTQDLSTKVDSLGLPAGIEKGLMEKLTAAQEKITEKHYTPARNLLNAFINQVNAQRGKALTVDQANELIAIAQRIINSIPGK